MSLLLLLFWQSSLSFLLEKTCCEAKRFSKNATWHFLHPFGNDCHQGNRLIYFLSLFSPSHFAQTSFRLWPFLMPFSLLIWWFVLCCLYICNSFLITHLVIIFLCYDKQGCDGSLVFLYGVITKTHSQHNNWLPIQSEVQRFGILL